MTQVSLQVDSRDFICIQHKDNKQSSMDNTYLSTQPYQQGVGGRFFLTYHIKMDKTSRAYGIYNSWKI